ncbi:MAG: hypothetical protein FJ264_13580 [Planctomycetes bacterium]|nr:hypothetical protein [Planctomycetota bacterium]
MFEYDDLEQKSIEGSSSKYLKPTIHSCNIPYNKYLLAGIFAYTLITANITMDEMSKLEITKDMTSSNITILDEQIYDHDFEIFQTDTASLELPKVCSLKVKIGKIKPMQFSSPEDENGFI